MGEGTAPLTQIPGSSRQMRRRFAVLTVVSLPQKDCHELLRQERLLEIRERQSDYLWAAPSAGESWPLPGQIRAQVVKELPVNEQLEAEKYAGMPWDIDPTTIETLLPFLAGK